MAVNLLDYQGNAGLGQGSGSGIAAPLGPNDNLKIINDTGRDIMLLDAERNMKMFQQKVADRDHVSELILKNEVSAGEIDPSYRKYFDDARQDSIKAFTEWGGDVNNTKGYQKYQDSINHLQDVATHAQTNSIELKKLIQQRSQETLPWKQKALDQHISAQQSKKFWDHVDPYQQMFSFSIDPINKLYKTATTTVTSPDKLWKYDLTHGDYSATLKNAQNEYLNHGEASEDMREWLGQADNYDPAQKKKFIDSINAQLQKYNAELDVSQGSPMYADPIDLVKGPDGKDHIKASPVDFAAKYALAQQEKYVVQGPGQFQKDVGTYGIGREKNQIAWAKLNKVDMPKAWAMIDKWKTQKAQLTQQEQVGAQKYNDLVNQIEISATSADGRTPSLFRLNTDQIPESRQFIGGITYGPSGKKMLGRLYPKMNFYDPKKKGNVTDKELGVDKYEQEIKDKKTTLPYPDWAKQKAKDKGFSVESYYSIKYYSPEGKQINTAADLPADLAAGYKKASIDYGMTFSQYLKGLAKIGKTVVQFQGQNGTATPETILEGSRLEQSYGKKGFEGIYGGDETGEGADIPDDDTPGQ